MERFGRRPRVKVGTRVGLALGLPPVLYEAWVVEDRGDIALNGEQMVTLYFQWAPGYEEWVERRASELLPPPDPDTAPAPRRRRRSAARRAATT